MVPMQAKLCASALLMKEENQIKHSGPPSGVNGAAMVTLPELVTSCHPGVPAGPVWITTGSGITITCSSEG